MGKNTKEHILEIGANLVHRQGFNNTGISEVLREADVPKGSFYFYFSSKEAFGLELVEFHRIRFVEAMRRQLEESELPPLDRLRGMFAGLRNRLDESGYALGCPIGNLSQEMGDLNPLFAKAIARVFDAMSRYAEGVLSQAKERGDIPVIIDPRETADFIVNSWQGALVRMKASKSPEPLDQFEKFVFSIILDQY
ncbi:TetR/AcrR family transcriptional regulator [Desulfovibrio oxyclinae]|uniref:TetR/AcrR family transcriptional regulator n=1 Tax=Desulfovibrio oxyclinae TaxID=63560 RepID=UPI00036B0B78|nr:TetR/AcrR family transcriptional regulator [Desulfovibrio oxyclinae]